MTRDAVRAWIGLGANLGDAPTQLDAALRALAGTPGVTLVAVSPLYRSAPVGAPGPDYHNAVAGVDTRLTAPALLERLLAIERAAGRERPYPNAPRVLDLDLLRYGSGRIDSPQLTLPHPRLRGRAFALRPLADLMPAEVPGDWLAAVADQPLWRIDWPLGSLAHGHVA